MNETRAALCIFTRTPVPGEVKTRLIPALGVEGAARFYRDMLHSTVGKAHASRVDNITLCCTPSVEHPVLRSLARQFTMKLELQRGRDLGQRMGAALENALYHYDCALVIGCDCPGLTTMDIDLACDFLSSGSDAVLGPATDGGYYLIGLSRALPELFDDMPWGSEQVLNETRKRLEKLGKSWQELPCYTDIDDEEDLRSCGFFRQGRTAEKVFFDTGSSG